MRDYRAHAPRGHAVLDALELTIVPMLRVGTQLVTLRVTNLQSGETVGVTEAQA